MASSIHPPSSSDATRAWRVFYTRARAEKKCEERLEQRAIEVLLPKRVVKRRWSDRNKLIVQPLFRNYIFANVNEKERLSTLRVNGIVRCVTFEGQPAILHPEEADRLQMLAKAPERVRAAEMRPDIGTTVTLTDGPLKGLTGDVTQHRGHYSLYVRITSIQQGVHVEIPAEWVTEVSS